MTSKIKNIIIIVVAAAVLIAAYFIFFNKVPEQANLTTTGVTLPSSASVQTTGSAIGADFLATLLSVKSITLDDSVLTDPAFASLHDSSIVLIPDQTEGRPNPFAPIGTDVLPAAPSTTTSGTTTNESGISGTVGAATGSISPTVPASSNSGTNSGTSAGSKNSTSSGTSTGTGASTTGGTSSNSQVPQ